MKQCKFSTRLSGLFAVMISCVLTAGNLLSPINAMASAPDEMSLEDAATLLKSHEMFSAVQTIKLNTGTIHASVSELEHYQPKYTTFKSMGLIELASVKIESPGKDTSKSIEGTRISLTEKGLKESKAWKQERKNEWIITIAVRKLVEVIKIHKQSERIHGIEFSWTWALNETGDALKFSYPTERAYAKLEPHENGWRIVKIHAL